MLDPLAGGNQKKKKKRLLYCPEDGAALPWPPLRSDAGGCFVGGHDGGWVAWWSEPYIGIVNIFSGAEIALCSEKRRGICRQYPLGIFRKIIFSEAPTSPGCILAGHHRTL
jgi:hypothetical protein